MEHVLLDARGCKQSLFVSFFPFFFFGPFLFEVTVIVGSRGRNRFPHVTKDSPNHRCQHHHLIFHNDLPGFCPVLFSTSDDNVVCCRALGLF